MTHTVRNFVPELWSTLLLESLKKHLVLGNLVNRNWEGEIRNQGDTVRINTPGPIAVRTYSGSVSYDQPTATQQALLIDQAKYFAFDVDDVDAAQANINLESPYITEGAYALADTVDMALAGLYTEADSLVEGSIVNTTTDPYEDLLKAGENLDARNVPRVGRWVVVTPRVYRWLLSNKDFIASSASDSAHGIVTRGEVGTIAGFTVHTSNNIVRTNSGKTSHNIYGTNAAITFAEQISKVETLRREESFADAVRGLLLYGHKVVRPAALGEFKVVEAS